MKNTKKGFTLVELLVVIAILAILASVAVVGYTAFIDKAKESNAKTEAHQIDKSIEAALMTKKAVKIENGIWVEKGTNGYKVVTEDPTTRATSPIKANEVDDLSSNFTAFAEQIDYKVDKLTYTSNGVTIDVDSGEVLN